jgi:hypothetical protein
LAVVACPFFFPTERISIGWPFPARLPLGAGFAGTCHAGADGVRFSLARDEESRIVLHYVSERFHEPVEYGRLEYDCQTQRWLAPMRDACLQRQAECYVAVYLERRPRKT